MKRLLVVVMLLILAACDGVQVEETFDTVSDDTTTTTTTTTTPSAPPPVPPVEETTTTAAANLGTRGKPIPLGDVAVVGNYEIMIVAFTPDATDVVLDYNEFNDPPPDDSVYTLIRLEFTYVGDESGDPWLDITWSGVGDSNVSSQIGDCITHPDDLFEVGELFPGGTVDGNICLTVINDDVDSLLLILEETFSFDETRVFFDLQTP